MKYFLTILFFFVCSFAICKERTDSTPVIVGYVTSVYNQNGKPIVARVIDSNAVMIVRNKPGHKHEKVKVIILSNRKEIKKSKVIMISPKKT